MGGTPAWPQSNQRGIETAFPYPSGGGRAGRLNRTSVGLKPEEPFSTTSSRSGLNRTSVGLKLEPQRAKRRLWLLIASIEPAWD